MKISVVICTYNNPNGIESTIKSVLANTYSDYELLIVNQSTSDEMKNIAKSYTSDSSSIKYLQSEGGKSQGLNLGIKKAKGEIIAFTDDDCVVSQDWVEQIALAFRWFPDASIVFGDLFARELDSSKEFIPEYYSKNKRFSGALSMKKGIGKGANMAIRKTVFDEVGYFDENLGPGTDLKASEDWDFTYRTLVKGLIIYDTNLLKVEHLGLRNLSSTIELGRNYHVSTIAFLVKNIRCGDLNALFLLLWITFIHCRTSLRIIKSITKWPSRFPRLLYYEVSICRILFWTIIGVLRCFQYPVDKKMRLFVAKS